MTDDPVREATGGLRAWLMSAQGDDALALRDRILDSAADKGAQLLVLRSDMVFGLDHLRSAMYHAMKATSEHRNVSESLAMETLLYASGERQLSTAIKKMSVDSSTPGIAIVQLTAGDIGEERTWRPLPSIRSDMPREAILDFGVSSDELATADARRVIDLVLEKVASVDITKR